MCDNAGISKSGLTLVPKVRVKFGSPTSRSKFKVRVLGIVKVTAGQGHKIGISRSRLQLDFLGSGWQVKASSSKGP